MLAAALVVSAGLRRRRDAAAARRVERGGDVLGRRARRDRARPRSRVGLVRGGRAAGGRAGTRGAPSLFLAVVTSIVGYIGWYWALDRGGIQRIATLQFLQPLSGFVLAVVVLGDHVTPRRDRRGGDHLRRRDRAARVAARRRDGGLTPTIARVTTLPARVLVVGLARSGARGRSRAPRAAASRSSPTTPIPPRTSAALDGRGPPRRVGRRAPRRRRARREEPGRAVLDAPPVVAARARGIPVISEIELGARLLPNPLLGVTGTNGKTTTTALLGAILEAGGVPGRGRREHRAAADVARRRRRRRRVDRVRALVLPARGRRDAAAAGRGADEPRARPPRPARVVRRLRRREAPRVRAPGAGRRRGRAARLRPAARERPDGSSSRPTTRCPPSRGSRGAHNRENAAAATAAARAVGVSDDAIAEALATFPGVEHRIEEIATVDGVLYVNDSKATNAAAALRALASFPGRRKHVILGGRGKAEPYDALAAAFEAGDRAYLIGESADDLARALDAADVPYVVAGTLERALARGRVDGRVAGRRRAPLAGVRLVRPVHGASSTAGRSSAVSWRSSRGGD